MFDKILVAVGGDDESFEPVRAASRLRTPRSFPPYSIQ